MTDAGGPPASDEECPCQTDDTELGMGISRKSMRRWEKDGPFEVVDITAETEDESAD